MIELRLPHGSLVKSGNRPLLMGIVNVTPDSFSDGGCFDGPKRGLDHALALLDDGADLIDIGGESTRPGSAAVPDDEECRRVVPVVEALRRARPGCIISVDTRKAAVAAAALEAGCDIINDVSGLAYAPEIAGLAAASGAGLVLMHSPATPDVMQQPQFLQYGDVVETVKSFLLAAAGQAREAGVPAGRIILDVGIGLGKTLEQNLTLLRRLEEFGSLGYPLLVGHSRKRFIGELLRQSDPRQRDIGTVGISLKLMERNCDILRVHAVKLHREAMTAYAAG